MAEYLLEVGDKIRVKNLFNDYVVEIERVTKTQAFSKPYNDAGAIKKFKRTYYDSGVITKLPREKWQTTSYTIIKKNGK